MAKMLGPLGPRQWGSRKSKKAVRADEKRAWEREEEFRCCCGREGCDGTGPWPFDDRP